MAPASTESMQDYLMDTTFDDEIPMDPVVDMMDNSVTPSQDQWLVQFEQGRLTERPGSPADQEITRAYEKMAGFCENLQPWHLYDSKAPLHHVVTRVKGFTNDVATRNATPFLHRHLYRDHTPRCILSCFTANVLYANRTPENTAMVMRALHSSARELIDAEAGRVVATPSEKLARTQALFLYQVIRLLDGDVILRAQAEKDIPLLLSWLADLCRVRENLADLAPLGDSLTKKQPPENWETWIFAESVRRTIVMAHSFMTLYDVMTDNEEKNDDLDPDPDPWSHVHRWTLSRHLWQADSASQFGRMWKEKPHFVITNYSFDHFLACGRGEDVDEFAEILLSVYMGVDETRDFISATNTDR